MRLVFIRQLSNFALSVAALYFLIGAASAQIDETGNRRPITRVKIQKIVKVVKVPEVRYQRISGLAITTVQPNADVSVKPAGTGRYRQTKKTDADGVLNLENVPPGKYILTVSLEGYVTEESEVDVAPQRFVTVPVNLAPITHDLFVKTNVARGEVRYAKVRRNSRTGSMGVEGYCMAPIENGTAAIARLQEGSYRLEIRPADVEYRPVIREINVSDEEMAKIETRSGRNELPVTLTRTISTEDFLASWLPNEWHLPAGWRIDNKRLQANGPGVALLQNERYNNYKDFELKTSLRSMDGRSVGIVVRAADTSNYYLIQLSGAASPQPFFLTGYVVKNGVVAETLVPISIKAYAKSISERAFFNLTITASGNIFRVRLEDVNTGESFVVGIIEDQNNTYPIGAIGIGSKDQSRFDVNNFYINYK